MNDGMWEVPIGVDADFGVQVTQRDGVTPIVFTGAEPIYCSVWQGDDLTPIAGVLTASWAGGDPAQGALVASVLGAGTAALASDYYQVRVTVLSANGRIYQAYPESGQAGWLSLLDAPGTAEAPATYCTLQDMVDVCGDWLLPLMQDSGKTSFLAERARASRMLEKAVVGRSRPYAMDGWIDLTIYTTQGGFEGPDFWLSRLIGQGRLVASDDVKEAVAYLAGSYVCERQITWDGDDPHRDRAAYYYQKWRARLAGLTVGVDYSTAGDGSAVRSFNMGSISSR